MNLIIFSGPPSSGKTSVILKTIGAFKEQNISVGVVKFDCLHTDDDVLYENAGVPVKKGLSGGLCPDHFFAANIEDVVNWGNKMELDLLITESAGLCNRCSPYLKEVKGICVIDNLSGVNTPKKIGPMLKSADIVVITKGDIVSQAEREVFASRVSVVNPKAMVMHINGLSGQGAYELSTLLYEKNVNVQSVQGMKLRFPMPAAMCSYCLGETRIGESYQLGNTKKMTWEEKDE
ncbi:MAG: GTP-binding protein [Lachnospirales bacterium]